MSIRFRCPCGKLLAAPDGAAGRRFRCPACGALIQVPGPAGDEPSQEPGARASASLSAVRLPRKKRLSVWRILYHVLGISFFFLAVFIFWTRYDDIRKQAEHDARHREGGESRSGERNPDRRSGPATEPATAPAPDIAAAAIKARARAEAAGAERRAPETWAHAEELIARARSEREAGRSDRAKSIFEEAARAYRRAAEEAGQPAGDD